MSRMETIPDNFLGLPPAFSDPRRARYAVLPVPYDSTTSFQVGTRNGPRAIITASQQVELYDEELGDEFVDAGIATLPPIAPEMAGPERQVQAVYEAARGPVRGGKFLLGLGGEHSITSGMVRAVREKHRDLSVLQIDAHADLRDEWEGTPWSHACVMRRVVESGVPIVQVGIRNYSKGEADFIRRKKLRPITAAEIHAESRGAALLQAAPPRRQGVARTRATKSSPTEMRAAPNWLQRAIDSLSERVFVTIDIDGLDPAYAPGTGTPEPGGLDWYQVTSLLKAVALHRQIVAADIVEVMPLPGSMQTEFLAAKLAYKLISYCECGRA